MKKYFFTIIIFLLSCAPTEPVETYDDNAILQLLLNMADSSSLGFLRNEFDIDGNGTLYCTELPNTLDDTVACTMENGRLTKIKLSNMGLSGAIPESIGDLTELTHLGLKNNNLSGVIPENIGNLTHLTQLNLADNLLSGSIPDTIRNLQLLWRLDLSNNQLTGSLPISISQLPILETFLVDSNNLSGTIPDDICNIYNQNSNFDLSSNQFCPPLPVCFDRPNDIGFQNCDTSCGLGNRYVNGYCYAQTDLDVLQAMIDSSLSLSPDSILMSMDADTSLTIEPLELGFQEWSAGRLEILDCYRDTISCNLSITIPENIDNLDSLKVLDLQNNNLSGKIPDGIGNLLVLDSLFLQDNNLTEGIPETMGDLPQLSTLKIENNKIGCYEFDFTADTCRTHCNDDIDVCNGYISENICKIKTIENVDLSNNMLCPCYPECITAEFSNFENSQNKDDCSYCNDGYTQICDDLPESVTIPEGDSLCFNTDNLAVLQAFIDSSRSNLKDSLVLSNATASIDELEPLELGEQTWTNGNLISFNARNLGLSGGIPQNIASMDSLLLLIISDNFLSGAIPDGIYNLNNLSSLDLARNQLSGEITEGIGNFTTLLTLLLSDNQLNGKISENICNLTLEFNKEIHFNIFDNSLCPPYPNCIEPYVGEQNTTECSNP